MNISLKKLNINDVIKEIELLKSFLPSENGFERNATDEDLKSIENFKIWINSRLNASNGIGLKEGTGFGNYILDYFGGNTGWYV